MAAEIPLRTWHGGPADNGGLLSPLLGSSTRFYAFVALLLGIIVWGGSPTSPRSSTASR